MKFSGGVEYGRKKKQLDLGVDTDYVMDPGSISRIFQHYEIGHTRIVYVH